MYQSKINAVNSIKAAIIMFSFSFFTGCTSETEEKSQANKINLDQAKEYQLLSKEDFSFAGRDRIQYNITSPDSDSFESLAQTGIKAAMDYQKQSRANVVTVFLGESIENINNGDAQAIIKYAPDGGGFSGDQGWKWQIEAIEPLSELEKKTLSLWEENSEKFKLEDGWNIDEEAFKDFAAEKLNVQSSDISLRMPVRKEYSINQ